MHVVKGDFGGSLLRQTLYLAAWDRRLSKPTPSNKLPRLADPRHNTYTSWLLDVNSGFF